MSSRWERVAGWALVGFLAVGVAMTLWTSRAAHRPEPATFGIEAHIDGLVVLEVVLVEGVGPEEQPVTLAAGTWRATVAVGAPSIDEAQITGIDGYRSTISWTISDSRPAVVVVGDHPDHGAATLYGREFRIGVNAIDEDPWSVTLERFGDPFEER